MHPFWSINGIQTVIDIRTELLGLLLCRKFACVSLYSYISDKKKWHCCWFLILMLIGKFAAYIDLFYMVLYKICIAINVSLMVTGYYFDVGLKCNSFNKGICVKIICQVLNTSGFQSVF